MSTCISRHGEFGSHDLDDNYVCKLCAVLDEDALIEELNRVRELLVESANAGNAAHQLAATANAQATRLFGDLAEASAQAVERQSELRTVSEERDALRVGVQRVIDRLINLRHDHRVPADAVARTLRELLDRTSITGE